MNNKNNGSNLHESSLSKLNEIKKYLRKEIYLDPKNISKFIKNLYLGIPSTDIEYATFNASKFQIQMKCKRLHSNIEINVLFSKVFANFLCELKDENLLDIKDCDMCCSHIGSMFDITLNNNEWVYINI